MEFMPRITRAQSMDILSSQANLAGYKAVLDAAAEYGRAFPMMMTAAGTVSAAKAFVMGVGVAGLQAIATARRLGAQVSATDVRSATKEQILSLGAKPIFVENVAGIEGEGSGGYATEIAGFSASKWHYGCIALPAKSSGDVEARASLVVPAMSRTRPRIPGGMLCRCTNGREA